MIQTTLQSSLDSALKSAFPDMDPSVAAALRWERPKNAEHGDYAVNVSPLAKTLKQSPPVIAESVSSALKHTSSPALSASVLGGFLNVKLSTQMLANALLESLTTPIPGKNNSLSQQSILLEYVSANPTGPLHVGHGRWAALGDSLVRLWQHCGAEVEAEFYINDAGSQMNNLGHSLWYRLHQQPLPTPVEGEPYPFYPGDYLIALGESLKADLVAGKFTTSLADANQQARLLDPQIDPFEIDTPEALTDRQWLTDQARQAMLADQQALLQKMGVTFDRWTSEKTDLYAKGLPEETLATLAASGMTYEQDNAVWLQSTRFGDEKDRVLKKSDGSYTYLTPDIAYHHQKFNRTSASGSPRYNRIVNLWGADHHGYITRMRAAIQALGHPVNQFEVLLGQLVNLIIDGEKTRMGKRRKMLTLADVVDEVGVDAVRFWMVSKSADTPLDFDVDLAQSQSNDNPVFYVQYAHARCAGILRNATEPGFDQETQTTQPPCVSTEALQAFQKNLSTETLQPLFDGLSTEAEDDRATRALVLLKTLVLKLDTFADTLALAAQYNAPHMVVRYSLELAADFHAFYTVCRILTPQPAVTLPRLMVVQAVQRVLQQSLALLGVSAPERM